MKKIVSVRFKPAGKAYYFDPVDLDCQPGDYVIVETARGAECGEVVPGMSRQEVLFAYGPPPACRTPSLRNETWIYWIAPEQTIRVVFRNDKVRNIINTNE